MANVDCLIVGGGPAGLTAAIYAARFRLSVAVFDAGGGRAAQIPCTRNHAGFPGGISGAELLARMRAQALEYSVSVTDARVQAIDGAEDDFTVRFEGGALQARTVIVATGVANHRPAIAETLHAEALARGLLRYCPVCDGFEVTDRAIAVIGRGDHGAREALFLRAFTARVTLIAPGGSADFDASQRRDLTACGVTILGGVPGDFAIAGERLTFTVNGRRLAFDSVYPALGSTVFSDLAQALGAELTADGCIKVDAHQRTSVAGLYAIGDVVVGLDQISHAMGQAGVAATTLRNDLAARAPILRRAAVGPEP